MTPRLEDFRETRTANTMVETTRSLICKENRAVRYAIVIYARVLGIPLKEEDLDALRDGPLSGEKPDLGSALVTGYDRFVTGLGNYAFRDALRRMRVR